MQFSEVLCRISNQHFCICDDPCLSKFGALHGGSCPHSVRQFVGLLCSTYLCSLIDIIKPREQNSLLSAIEIRADSSSNICFARLCFTAEVQVSAARKSYKLSPGCGHDPRSAPNLERHGSSKMQTSGWLEMPYFLIRISTCISI